MNVLERNYKALLRLLPGVPEAPVEQEWRLVAPGFMDLVCQTMERRGHCVVVSLAHSYVQNGDLMWDPRVDVILDPATMTAAALDYEQSGLGVYHERPKAASWTQHVWDTDRFVESWLRNIRAQGHPIVAGVAA